jgi:hypothetical protein
MSFIYKTSVRPLNYLLRHGTLNMRQKLARATESPEVMDRLRNDPAPEVRRAVVGNLLVSMATLSLLARDCQARATVLALPKIAEAVRLSRDLTASPSELAALADHPIHEVRANVAANPAAPPAVLRRLYNSSDSKTIEGLEIRQAIALNPNTPEDILGELYESKNGCRQAVVENAKIQACRKEVQACKLPAKLEEHARHPVSLIRQAVAENSFTLPETLGSLADDFITVKQALARHPKTPATVLDRLADEDDRTTVEAVMRHAGTPWETLAKLCAKYWRDYDDVGPRELRQNPKIAALLETLLRELVTPEQLTEIAENPIGAVKYFVARHPLTSADCLRTLAECPDAMVRLGVARNVKTSVDVLGRLAEDEDERVATAARLHPTTLRLVEAAKAAQALPELAKLSSCPIYTVRAEVAKNPAVSPELLLLLSRDKNFAVKVAVARSVLTPEPVFRDFAGSLSDEPAIELALIDNHKTPPDILIEISWRAIAQREPLRLASHPSLPAEETAFLLKTNPARKGDGLAEAAAINKHPLDKRKAILLELEKLDAKFCAVVRPLALCGIAAALYRSGKDKNEIAETISLAIAEVAKHKSLPLRYQGLKCVTDTLKQLPDLEGERLAPLCLSVIETANSLDSENRAKSLNDLAGVVPGTVADKERAAQILLVMFDGAAAIGDPQSRYKTQENIASAMAKAGVSTERVAQLFQNIVDKVYSSNEYPPLPKNIILSSLAQSMGKAGVDNKKVARAFQLAVAQSKDQALADTEICNIAVAMYKSGMDKDWVAATIRSVMAEAAKREPKFLRYQGLKSVTDTLMLLPDLGEERLTALSRSLVETARSLDSENQAATLKYISQKNSEISAGGGR